MLQGLNGCESFRRLHSQERLDEAERFGSELAQVAFFYGIKSVDLGKFHAQKPLIFEEGFRVVWSQRTETLLDQEELVDFVLAWEHRLAVHKLPKNTTDGPQINLLAVARSYEKLRRPVPPRSNVIGEFFTLFRSFEWPCKTEIAYLEHFLFADEKVLGLDVTVHKVERMHVGKSLDQLVHERTDEFRFESRRRLL